MRPLHLLRQSIRLLFLSSFLLLWQCGTEVEFDPGDCQEELGLVHNQPDRYACAYFQQRRSELRVVQFKDGQFQFCKALGDCNLGTASISRPSASGSNETLYLLYPPTQKFSKIGDVADACADVLNREKSKYCCWNDGKTKDIKSLNACWLLFRLTYQRNNDTAKCWRWLGGIDSPSPQSCTK